MGNEKPVRRIVFPVVNEHTTEITDVTCVLASDYDSLQQRERKLREALGYCQRELEDEEVWRWPNTMAATVQECLRTIRVALRSSDHIEGEK